MEKWEHVLITPDTTLREALSTIERGGCQIAIVVDTNRRLLGTLSDGDARRGLLRGLTLSDNAAAAMHAKPRFAQAGSDQSLILASMKRQGVRQMPLVDHENVVVGLALIDEYLSTMRERDNIVIVMAGGLGSRLKELTRETPKPMLQVGSRPLLETIVRSYAKQGFSRFYFAVNYKAEKIEEYFRDGASFGVHIQYLREQERLGTAGALSLLPIRPSQPFLVTNADLLTNEDFGHMVDAHVRSGVDASMGVRDYEMQVPFGVVRELNGAVQAIEEKPVQRFVVSAGVSVFSPDVLDFVPRGVVFDMPALFEALLAAKRQVRCHRIDGYWMDIGRLADFERANLEFQRVFR